MGDSGTSFMYWVLSLIRSVLNRFVRRRRGKGSSGPSALPGPPVHWLELFQDSVPQWQSFGDEELSVRDQKSEPGSGGFSFSGKWGEHAVIPVPQPGITNRIRNSWEPEAAAVRFVDRSETMADTEDGALPEKTEAVDDVVRLSFPRKIQRETGPRPTVREGKCPSVEVDNKNGIPMIGSRKNSVELQDTPDKMVSAQPDDPQSIESADVCEPSEVAPPVKDGSENKIVRLSYERGVASTPDEEHSLNLRDDSDFIDTNSSDGKVPEETQVKLRAVPVQQGCPEREEQSGRLNIESRVDSARDRTVGAHEESVDLLHRDFSPAPADGFNELYRPKDDEVESGRIHLVDTTSQFMHGGASASVGSMDAPVRQSQPGAALTSFSESRLHTVPSESGAPYTWFTRPGDREDFSPAGDQSLSPDCPRENHTSSGGQRNMISNAGHVFTKRPFSSHETQDSTQRWPELNRSIPADNTVWNVENETAWQSEMEGFRWNA